MTNSEKCEMLKPTIYQLYSKEGRSKSYISRLLNIDRKILIYKIQEWGLPEAEPVRYMKPSTEKFLNRNKDYIISQLQKDLSQEDIAASLNCNKSLIQTLFLYDEDLKRANEEKNNRMHAAHQRLIQQRMEASSYNYNIIDEPNEVWMPIIGYSKYMISNYGRVKHYASEYNAYYLITPYINRYHNRVMVSLVSDTGESKTLNLARLVAHAFIPGHSEICNTVNHKDGNTLNNHADNLEWMSQADNNLHAYRVLGRSPAVAKKTWKEIIYQGQYRFKTVRAFAKFIGKSETQAHRYINEPEKYGIELVY